MHEHGSKERFFYMLLLRVPCFSISVCMRHLTSSSGHNEKAAKKAANDPASAFCTVLISSTFGVSVHQATALRH